MRKMGCYEHFAQGFTDRKKWLLHRGLYKLQEVRKSFQSDLEEVVRIERHVRKKTSYPGLVHCTQEDKYIWLKRLPGYIAYMLSFNVLTGLVALEGDQIDQKTIIKIRSRVEPRIDSLIHELERIRCLIAKNIHAEYSAMSAGNSLLTPLVERAIALVDEILTAVDSPHLQEVNGKIKSSVRDT